MFHDDDQPSPFPSVPGLEVLELVARGGHGSVYCARQLAHDRMVALKVLDVRLDDGATRRRFDRERTALGRISDHPSIVSLLDSGTTNEGAPFVLMEFVPGGTLEDRLLDGPLSVAESTSLGIELAAALQRAHDAGVIHRDIKPANIMRSAYGGWMLADFGVASLTDRALTGAVHVSYAHTAPESLGGGEPAPSVDVYSLASVVATCLTGREPYRALADEAPVATMHRVATTAYPDLTGAGVPDPLAHVLSQALDREPDRRPPTAKAFADRLNDSRAELGLAPVTMRTDRADEPGGTGHTVEVDLSQLAPLPPAAAPPPDVELGDRSGGSSSGSGSRPVRRSVLLMAFAIPALIAALITGSLTSLVSAAFDDSTVVEEPVRAQVDDGLLTVADTDGAASDADADVSRPAARGSSRGDRGRPGR